MSSRLDPALFANAFVLESADIPAGMTIAEWRSHRPPVAGTGRARRRAGRRWRLRRTR